MSGKVHGGSDGRRDGPDWLVDGVGAPDGVERDVESALRGARWDGDVDGLMARLDRGAKEVGAGGGRRRLVIRRSVLAMAAAVTLAAGVWVFGPWGGGAVDLDSWRRVAGSGGKSGAVWSAGAWIETGAGEAVEVASDAVGRVTVGPDSRVRLVRAGEGEHRLELAEGSIEAFIYAPPRLFYVDTPGATAVDMGCAYEMDVEADGSGVLRVTGGWVELQNTGEGAVTGGFASVSRVPAGSVCRLGAGGVPGLPWFEDAGEGFGGLVEDVESGEAGALDGLLEAARARDGLTLWHLVVRTAGQDRARVVARLLELVPPRDAGVGAAVVSGDRSASDAAMEAWWYDVRRSW